jgi:hypothetical protein
MREFRNGKIPIQEDERGVVFELAIGGPLHANELRRQDGESCVCGSNHRTRVGYRIIRTWCIGGFDRRVEQSQRTHCHHEQATAKPVNQVRQ